jgi:DNA polymerase-1
MCVLNAPPANRTDAGRAKIRAVPEPRLFLIDTFGFIFRAYHARAHSGAPPMRTSTGLATEAVYIFIHMLRKLTAAHSPEYLAAVFESEGPTHREREFAAYKANRAPVPPDLPEQIPYVRRLLEALRVPVLEAEGFEADDVIGSLARRAAQDGIEVVIVSSDKDMMQLVGGGVRMLNPAKNDEWYDAAKVREFLGVEPGQVADLLALKGDKVDNILGAPGIGDKGARDLIARFGGVEAAIQRASEVERKAYRESLREHADQIRLSKRLATIDCAVPVEFHLEALRAREADTEALRALYRELEFHSLLRDLGPAVDTPRGACFSLRGAAAVSEWLASVPAGAPVAVAVAPDAIGLAWEPDHACAVPTALAGELRTWLEDETRPKIVSDLKSALLALDRLGIQARGFVHDVMLYAFLLDPDPAARKLDLEPGAVLEMFQQLDPLIDERGLRALYAEIELPLAPVLARMERTGIRVDRGELERLSALMETEISRLTAEIHALAGKPFNIASPQQLAKVLFEDMGLAAPARRGKTKNLSTAADVLEEIDHPIARQVLEYRQLAKLKGTYVDALPALINPATGRLHTSFNQTGAATGRLSSSGPNLQNIPVRTELGRQIRAAFVPREGWTLLAADYSQIELRLLAHMSRDPALVDAFRRGEDIHTRTASEVLGVPPLMVTPEARREAKAVNFGIVYGISAFGLAAQLGIRREEAQAYIDNYFKRYQGVRRFLDATIEEVRQTGIARTLHGRQRPIPDMLSRNPNARGFAERTAVNTPLQGTAADLIKLAMVRIDKALAAGGFRTAMLLQVHDELVFECPPEEIDPLTRLVRREMENVYSLEVPLVVDIGHGANWRDA